MKREIKITGDGSKTLFISEMNESYHSTHGALQEAVYVFIKNGINLVKKEEIHILEMGFGTGLNLLVTIDNYIKNQSQNTIRYFTIEKYPVLVSEIEKLDYPHLFGFENVKEI